MRDLRQLDVAVDSEHRPVGWNRRKGLVFLGCVIMAACAALGGWYVSKLPRGVEPGEIRVEIDALEPAAAFIQFHTWERVKFADPGKLIQDSVKPLYQGTFENSHPLGRFITPKAAYHSIGQTEELKAHSFWLPIVIAGGVTGLLIALSALFVRNDAPRPQPSRVAAPRA
jgi:hypothetical protein